MAEQEQGASPGGLPPPQSDPSIAQAIAQALAPALASLESEIIHTTVAIYDSARAQKEHALALANQGKELDRNSSIFKRVANTVASSLGIGGLAGDMLKLSVEAIAAEKAIGVLIKTLGRVDEYGAAANKTVAALAVQTGTPGAGSFKGIGGLFSSLSPDMERLKSSVIDTEKQMHRLGFSVDQSNKTIIAFATRLPRDVASSLAPAFATYASRQSSTTGIDLTTTTSIITEAYRRNITTVEGMNNVFNKIIKTSEKANLTHQETAQAVFGLWQNTFRLGGTFDSASATVAKFGNQLLKGTVTLDQLASIRNQGVNSPPEKFLMIAQLAKTYGVDKSLYSKVFGTGDLLSAPGYALSHFNEATFSTMIKQVIDKMTEKTPFGANTSYDKMTLRQFLTPSIAGINNETAANLYRINVGLRTGEPSPDMMKGVMGKNYTPATPASLEASTKGTAQLAQSIANVSIGTVDRAEITITNAELEFARNPIANSLGSVRSATSSGGFGTGGVDSLWLYLASLSNRNRD